jgi:ATP-dependent Clp protease protease subunit
MHQARKLMALIATNQAKPKRYEIVSKADSEEATIYLYDVIDSYFGISATQFVRDLNSLKAPTIHLRINSPGGDVFDGRAIATAIAQHPSKIVAHVDGLAASAASWVALSAAEVEMSPGSFFMIHNAWTMAYGNKDDLRSTADVLDKIDTALIEDYVRQTGNSAEQIAEWMNSETWFTAEEAVDKGFADRVTESAATKNEWDLSVFAKAPAALAQQQAEDDSEAIAHDERKRRFELIELAA